MEYLRNLPSKTSAFSTANYERVRGSGPAHNRPFFSTTDQTPHQVLPSNDENLILAAIRQKKQATAMSAEPPKRPTTPEIVSSSSQVTPQPPRLFKRPRIALSNAAAATAAAAAGTSASASTPSSSSSYSSPSST